MKAIYLSLILLLISQSSLLAHENIVEFRLSYEKERPNTEVIIDKDVGRVFVARDPFITISNILKANLKIDNSDPPPWLEQAIKSSGGTIIRHQIKIELLLNESGKKIFKRITSENVGKRAAIFVDGKCIMAPVIEGVIDNESFFITTGLNENEARELVDRINSTIINK